MKAKAEVIVEAPESCKVATPRALAEAMVRALGDHPDARWLEPGVGRGVFLDVLSESGVPRNRIRAIDVDPQRGQSDRLAVTSRPVDFLRWSQRTKQRFDRIVGNPPYVPIRRLAPSLRDAAMSIKALGGGRVPLGANTWYAFICASLDVLKANGSLAFVLPAAWEYADYAAPLRDRLQSQFETFAVYRCRSPLFQEVLEGAVVIVGQGYRKAPWHSERHEYASPERMIRMVANGSTNGKAKPRKATWRRGPPARAGSISLGDIMDFRLGGVAGDVDYFLMDETDRRERGLPEAAMRRVVTKAEHIKRAALTGADWSGLRDSGARIWLFSPPERLLSHRAVKEYLALGQVKGGCATDRFKIRNRIPWYRTPLPRSVHGFVSGMSGGGPWICISEMERLNATNTLYTVTFRQALSGNGKYAWALSLLTSPARTALGGNCRIYAQGLRKHEPGDLARTPVPRPSRVRGAKGTYRRALKLLLEGDEAGASRLADAYFGL